MQTACNIKFLILFNNFFLFDNKINIVFQQNLILHTTPNWIDKFLQKIEEKKIIHLMLLTNNQGYQLIFIKLIQDQANTTNKYRNKRKMSAKIINLQRKN